MVQRQRHTNNVHEQVKISIIVPAYNSELYLEECINSLLTQTLLEIEIIIIDDGSTDRTSLIVDHYIQMDSRIKGIHQMNQGLSVARNKGLSIATGEYVSFVDSDDWISKDACGILYKKAIQSSADIVLGASVFYHKDGRFFQIGNKESIFIQKEVLDGKSYLTKSLKEGSYTPMVWGNLYRKQYLDSFHLLFDGCVHEDERFTPYALYYAERIVHIEKCLYFYRQHEQSIMHSYQLDKRSSALATIANELCEFVNTHMLSDIQHKETLSALLWQAHFLYIRSIRISEQLLRQSDIIYTNLPPFIVHQLTRYQNHFSSENIEWLEEIHLHLVGSLKKMEFVQQCRTNQKQIFFFINEALDNVESIKRYLDHIINNMDITNLNISIVTLYPQETKYSIEKDKGVSRINIPCPCPYETTINSHELKSKYLKTVFYLLAKDIRYRQISCHFNDTHAYILAMLFRKKLSSKNILTLHDIEYDFNSTRMESTFEDRLNLMNNCCDKIIADNKHTYTTVCQHYQKVTSKLEYIPNALPKEYL